MSDDSNADRGMDEHGSIPFEDDLCSTPGSILGNLVQAAAVGVMTVMTAPVWILGLSILGVQKVLKPKTRVTRRGTVRPLRPIQ